MSLVGRHFVKTTAVKVIEDNGANLLIANIGSDSRAVSEAYRISREHFNQTYCEITGPLNFGGAIEALKSGCKVAREGWNGKGMFIYHVRGTVKEAHELRNEAGTHVAGDLNPFDDVVINSHVDMKAADGSIVVGWLASQTDMLAEDWVIVD